MYTRTALAFAGCLALLGLSLLWQTGTAGSAGSPAERDLRLREQQLDRDEAKTFQDLATNEQERLAHNELGKVLKRTSQKTVVEFNQAGERGQTEFEVLTKKLVEIHHQRLALLSERERWLDEARLRWLRQRSHALQRTETGLDARLERTRALLERLKREGLRDASALQAAAQEFAKADEAVTREVLGLVCLQMLARIGTASRALAGIDLRRYPGKQHAEFRQAVREARAWLGRFNDHRMQVHLQRVGDARGVLQTAPGLLSPAESGHAAAAFSVAMQALAGEVRLRTRLGEGLLNRYGGLRVIEKSCGQAVWGEVATALSLGESACNLWAIRGGQMGLNREVERIGDEAAQRDHLLRAFSPGGTYFKTYAQEIEQRRWARHERLRCLVEAREIERRLARGQAANR